MKYCPACDMCLYEGNFCRTCGMVLIEVKRDKCECGHSLSEYDNYCKWCGKEVKVQV
jgi:hypothetical protein